MEKAEHETLAIEGITIVCPIMSASINIIVREAKVWPRRIDEDASTKLETNRERETTGDEETNKG